MTLCPRPLYNIALVDAVIHLLRWFGKGIAEHTRTLVIVALVSAVTVWIVAVRSWLAGQADCMIHGSCSITGPRLTVLVLVVYVLVLGVGVLAVMLRRLRARATELQQRVAEVTARLEPPPFEPVLVEDQRCHLRWSINRPPSEWLEWAAPFQTNQQAVADVIGGPFHSEGCNGRLGQDWSTPARGAFVEPQCPTCDVQLWNPLIVGYESTRINLVDMRWQVLRELQRLHRNDNPLTSTVVLERPEYWKAMEEPAE
jgi:hypothetical protein